MIMMDRGYMVSHMRNDDCTVNVRNVVMAAACEATELFQCMMGVDPELSDWSRFVSQLERFAGNGDYEKVHTLCQTLYTMKHLTEELEGLYLVREDKEICSLYYQVFIGMLDLTIFSAETMVELNGGK